MSSSILASLLPKLLLQTILLTSLVARFRRYKAVTRGKQALKHASTMLVNIGSASVPTKFVIAETEGGARSVSGAPKSVQSFRSTDETCQVGDCIKYVNVIFQASPRLDQIADSGWIEWAIVGKREADVDIPIGQTGVQTLGVIANQMYRNEVIYTGVFPVGKAQANSQSVMVKIPKTKQWLHIGDTIVVFAYFRSNLSTDVSTDRVRLVMSYIYKSYG